MSDYTFKEAAASRSSLLKACAESNSNVRPRLRFQRRAVQFWDRLQSGIAAIVDRWSADDLLSVVSVRILGLASSARRCVHLLACFVGFPC